MKDFERLQKAVKYLIANDYAKNQTEAGLLLGYKSQAGFNLMFNGKRPITTGIWLKLLTICDNFNLDWLRTGSGEMITFKNNYQNYQHIGNVKDSAVSQSIVGGSMSNKSATNNNENNKEWFEIIKQKDEQLNKSQTQIDRLLSLLEQSKK
jgi:hypothetical protein